MFLMHRLKVHPQIYSVLLIYLNYEDLEFIVFYLMVTIYNWYYE